MSGIFAPERTAMPIGDSATAALVPGMISPFAAS
jgi:hypothetical protein